MAEIRRSPAEVGSLSTIIYKVLAPSQVGFLAGFLPSTAPSGKLKLLEIHHHTSNRIRTSTLTVNGKKSCIQLSHMAAMYGIFTYI